MNKSVNSRMTVAMATSVVAVGLALSACSHDGDVEASLPLNPSVQESRSDSVYSDDYGLYIMDSDTTVYNPISGNAKLNARENSIGRSLARYAVKMLIDYGQPRRINTVLSPQSATTLYSMMANFSNDKEVGASNDYQNEMDVSGISIDDLNTYNRKISAIEEADNSEMGDDAEQTEFAIQNNIWMKQGKTVYKSFVATSRAYRVRVKGIDFSKPSDVAVINNSIKDVVGKDGLGVSSAKLKNMESMVSSSLSFRQFWNVSFNESKPTDYKFKPESGDSLSCAMLYDRRFARHADYGSFTMLEIPYKDNKYAMYILLPHEKNSLSEALAETFDLGLDKVIEFVSDTTRSYHSKTLEKRVTNVLYKGSYYVVTDTVDTDTVVSIRLPKLKHSATMELYDNSGALSTSKRRLFESNLHGVSTSGFQLNNIYQSCYLEISKDGTIARAKAEGLIINGAPVINTNASYNKPYIIHDPNAPIVLPKGEHLIRTVVKPFFVVRPFAVFIREQATGAIPFSACIKTVEND